MRRRTSSRSIHWPRGFGAAEYPEPLAVLSSTLWYVLLGDLLDVDLLARHVRDGNVSVRDHPTAALQILNYTPTCQYARAWDDVTRQCRGLIVHTGWDDVVARPWPKFFNYGEHEGEAAEWDTGALVEVTDKLDGSLGILYPVQEGQYAVATRGSFESEQALRGTAIWHERYSHIKPSPGWTWLFEILYPENRIVVDYEGLEDLVLLGAVNIETGVVQGPYDTYWPGEAAESFPCDTLRVALAMEPRPNAEGLVVRFLASGMMLKLKQEDYVALHRIVTGLSERGVWERLSNGESVADICEGLPDEFAAWVQATATDLEEKAERILKVAVATHQEILDELPGWEPLAQGKSADYPEDYVFALPPAVEYPGRTQGLGGTRRSRTLDHEFRRAYAERAKQHRYLAPYLFMLLDGKDPQGAIWRSVRP